LDPGAVELQDDELVRLSVHQLTPLLKIVGDPTLARVYRWQQAGAQHDVMHPQRMERLHARLERFPGLYVTGSGFRSVGVPDCIADGCATAAAASTLQER
jgi:oxygen-dependent protoporphyrinogen oxidase